MLRMEGLGKENMSKKGIWGFILAFCLLWLLTILERLLHFDGFSPCKFFSSWKVKNLMSLDLLHMGCPCVTVFPMGPAHMRLELENSTGRSWPHIGESPSSGCGGAIVSTLSGAAVAIPGVWSQAGAAEWRCQWHFAWESHGMARIPGQMPSSLAALPLLRFYELLYLILINSYSAWTG